jgi:VanZ family protein
VRARRWLGALAPLVAYAGVIYAVSAQSHLDVRLPDVPQVDKGIHAVEYGVFGFLAARAVELLAPRGPVFAATMALAIGACYGASDELHQRFVPGRDSDGWDLLADTVGSALGGLAYLLLARARDRRRRGHLAGESP